MNKVYLSLCLSAVLMSASVRGSAAADYVSGAFEKSRAYSTAVITKGGRVVWLAGEGGAKDDAGKDISDDFEAQVNLIFAHFQQTLGKLGGTNDDIVKMTVFIKDEKDGTPFVNMRKKFFPSGNYPASSLITIKDLAQPGWKIEIEGFAVIGDECAPGSCVK